MVNVVNVKWKLMGTAHHPFLPRPKKATDITGPQARSRLEDLSAKREWATFPSQNPAPTTMQPETQAWVIS